MLHNPSQGLQSPFLTSKYMFLVQEWNLGWGRQCTALCISVALCKSLRITLWSTLRCISISQGYKPCCSMILVAFVKHRIEYLFYHTNCKHILWQESGTGPPEDTKGKICHTLLITLWLKITWHGCNGTALPCLL